ncbi:radical SAM protein [Burkholderia sp. BCC0398]|uniref:radical SAM/SPASM domain-containing protein n=1 Tax=Burkholderia sp. BCC0398 TaxID=2676297 RepID=UPI00158F3774|nr:radical SAM protein [Burkholderia sp. BCC0398]
MLPTTDQKSDPLLSEVWDRRRDAVDVRMLQVSGQNYAYHIPTNSIFNISSPVGALLSKLLDGRITALDQFGESDFAAAKQLVALRSVKRLPLDEANLPITHLAISPTLKCNLRCTYCYNFQEAAETEIRKTQDIDKDAIGKILCTLGQLSVGDRVNLAFIGGEPFLYPQLLDKLARFARAKAQANNKSLILLVTTNGLNLGKERVKRSIIRNDLRVSLSLDGPPAWHNQTRKLLNGSGSFGAIQRNIDQFFEYYPHPLRAARATYKLTPGRLITTYRFLRDLGFNDISTGSHEFEVGAVDESLRDELLSEVDDLASEIESDFIGGRIVRHAWFSEVISNLALGRVKDVVCGATRNHIAFDVYGRMQACHRYLGNEAYELFPEDINKSQKSVRVAEIRAPGKTSHCTECWARSLCGGECFHVGKEIEKQPDRADRQLFLCDYKRKKYEAATRIFVRLAENHPEVLARIVNPISRP